MTRLTQSGATFIHLHSESGDDYYIARPELLTADQVEGIATEYFADSDEDYGETVFIEHVERLSDDA